MLERVEADVAVIGAGPAGSTLAALLAMRGRSVAVLDREAFPRDKVCGEFLSYDALPVLDLIGASGAIEEAGAPPIERCIVAGRGSTIEFAFPEPARGISRLVLDSLLLRNAERSGAIRLDGLTATGVGGIPGAREIALSGGERTAGLRARVVVGGWGRWGRMDLDLGRSFTRETTHRHFGFKRHYRAQDGFDRAIRLFSFRGGYLGVSSVEGGLVNICGLVHGSRISGLKGGWEAFVSSIQHEEPKLAELFGSHVPAQDGFLSSDPVIFRARSAAAGDLLMIGDAAGLIDPLTGNGMAMAVQSALLAAPFVMRALDAGDAALQARGYVAAHRDFFASRIRWSRAIAILLGRPGALDISLRAPLARRIARMLLERTRADRDKLDQLISEWRAAVRNL